MLKTRSRSVPGLLDEKPESPAGEVSANTNGKAIPMKRRAKTVGLPVKQLEVSTSPSLSGSKHAEPNWVVMARVSACKTLAMQSALLRGSYCMLPSTRRKFRPSRDLLCLLRIQLQNVHVLILIQSAHAKHTQHAVE